MAWTYRGEKSLGAVCIGVALAVPALSASLADLLSRIASLQAQIAGNLSLVAALPDPTELAAALAQAALDAAAKVDDILSSIPAPLIEANVGLRADLAILVELRASLETLLGTLRGALDAGGIYVWSVDSTSASLAADASAALAGGIPGAPPGARVQGVCILAANPASVLALSTLIAI